LREAVTVALLPLQRVAAVPVRLWQGGGDHLGGLRAALDAEQQARAELAALSLQAQRAQALAVENERLRGLLALQPALPVKSLAAQVLYAAADPFSRKVVIDRGQAQGVELGSPVLVPEGVLGQVTRVFALTSEVTLLSDRDAAIPVLNTRSQQRSAALGGPGGMELRFMSSNADVQVGDELQTSGVDGIYPAGLAVGRVAEVQRRVDSGFARIVVALAAQPDGVRHVLVLKPLAADLPPRPEPEAAAAPTRAQRKGTAPVVRGDSARAAP
jgi:rod shape-determining protein MreC